MDDDSSLRTFQVSRRHARNLGVQIGETIFTGGPAHGISELVANTHDADAKNARVIYSPDNDLIEIIDDGCGMREGQGLESYFALGGSQKRDMKEHDQRTTLGRNPIGHFGWGSIAVRYLARTHILETWKDGVYTRVEEHFRDDDSDDDPITVIEEACDHSLHGTKITLRDLRDHTRRMEVNDLVQVLSTQMPTELPDFQMAVNDVQITPPEFRNAVEYLFTVNDSLIGKVAGSIFFSPKTIRKVAGVYTKVNNRGVGGTNPELLRAVKSGLAERIYAVVHADGMDDQIVWGREAGFLEGQKRDRLYDIIARQLRVVRQDQEGGERDLKLDAAREALEERFAEIGSDIATKLGEVDSYTFNFTDTRAGNLLHVDRAEKIIYVKPTVDAFRMAGCRPGDINAVLSRLVEYSIANALITRPSDWQIFEQVVNENGVRLFKKGGGKRKQWRLADVLPESGKADTALRIVDTRLYTAHEVSLRTGWHREYQKRLVSSGLLKTTKERILGSDLVSTINQMSHYVTLFEAVRMLPIPEEVFASSYAGNTQRKVEGRLNKLDASSRPTWIFDLNKNEGGAPLYAVQKDDLARFNAYILEGGEEGEFASLQDVSGIVERITDRYQATFNMRLFEYLAANQCLTAEGIHVGETQVALADDTFASTLLEYLGRPDNSIDMRQATQALFMQPEDQAYGGVVRLTELEALDPEIGSGLQGKLVDGFTSLLRDEKARVQFMGTMGYLTSQQAIERIKPFETNRANAVRNAIVKVRGAEKTLGMYHPSALGLEG